MPRNCELEITICDSGGGSRAAPYAFTEQGVAMLSSVLRSRRAVMVNVEIMRAFVRLRQMLASNADLARKLATLEKKYDAQFKIVFDAIRELMTPPDSKKKRPIGFVPWKEKQECSGLWHLPGRVCAQGGNRASNRPKPRSWMQLLPPI